LACTSLTYVSVGGAVPRPWCSRRSRFCLSELGPVSRVAASGCGGWGAGSLRGCPGLSGSATGSGSVTWWLIGHSGWSDSGRSVFGGPPPVGSGSRESCGSWPEAWSSRRAGR